MKPWLLIAALFLTLGLAACGSDKADKDAGSRSTSSSDDQSASSDSSSTDKSSDSADDHHKDKHDKDDDSKEKRAMPICPQVAILAPLDHIRDYGGEDPDPSQLVAQAKMIDIQGTCAYEDNGIDVTFDLNMAAGRGPRLGGLHTSFPYFAAVVGPDGKILNKEPMTAEFGFASDEKISYRKESLHVFIPLTVADQDDGPDYRVLMGFQLSDEEYQKAVGGKPAKQP